MTVRRITDDMGRVYFRAECLEPGCGNRSHRYLDAVRALHRLERHRLYFH